MKKQFLLLLTAFLWCASTSFTMNIKQQMENMQPTGSIAPLIGARAAVVSDSSITLDDMKRMYESLNEELSEEKPSPSAVAILHDDIQKGNSCPGLEAIATLSHSVNKKLEEFNRRTAQSKSIFSRAGNKAIEKITVEINKANPNIAMMNQHWRIALAARNNLKEIDEDLEPSFENRLEPLRKKIRQLEQNRTVN